MSRLKIIGPFIGLILSIFMLLVLYFNWAVASIFLQRIRSFGEAAFQFAYLNETSSRLKLENENLKAEVLKLNKNDLESIPNKFMEAETFSRYPWNDRFSLIVNAGANNGIKSGMPVLAAKNILIGFVKTAKFKTSEVATIFSPDWKTVVRIGESGVEAVLIGGREPRLELIQKQGVAANGDLVLNASPELPLNLLIGEVDALEKSKTSSFEKAKLKIAYDRDDLKKVIIVTDHESHNP